VSLNISKRRPGDDRRREEGGCGNLDRDAEVIAALFSHELACLA